MKEEVHKLELLSVPRKLATLILIPHLMKIRNLAKVRTTKLWRKGKQTSLLFVWLDICTWLVAQQTKAIMEVMQDSRAWMKLRALTLMCPHSMLLINNN
jgi:hypothetical protein